MSPLIIFRTREPTNDREKALHVYYTTSCDLSGNKVRKLEFLLSEAAEKRYDSVITIGGLQSNHARATAVAARQLGLDPYLILRTSSDASEIDLTGS